MNKILKIINEEIDRVISENIRSISMLLEQDPNALPPADPEAVPSWVTPTTPVTETAMFCCGVSANALPPNGK